MADILSDENLINAILELLLAIVAAVVTILTYHKRVVEPLERLREMDQLSIARTFSQIKSEQRKLTGDVNVLRMQAVSGGASDSSPGALERLAESQRSAAYDRQGEF